MRRASGAGKFALGLLVVLALFSAGCGQKPGVHQLGQASNWATSDGEAIGEAVPGSSSLETSGTVQPGADTSPGSRITKTPAAAAGRSDGGTGGGGVTGDRTGVTDTEIVIGVHAPVTGAAPFPQTTFDKGKDVYWKWLAGRGGLFGRKVRVEFGDDAYTPSRAQATCMQLIQQKKVFLLVGGGGADQIQACGQYAASVGVPYLSAGVMEVGLKGLKSYFAASMSYPQQAVLMAQYIVSRLDGAKKKVAIVRANTVNFDDVRSAFLKAAQTYGINVVRDDTVPKDPDDNALMTEAVALKNAGVEIVFWVTAPVTWIHEATAANDQGYHPMWVTPGITIGENVVAQTTCSIDPTVRARSLTPFQNLDVIDNFDPEFRKAYEKYVTSENSALKPDDIGIALWGLSKVLHQAFLKVGSAENLTRESFVAALEKATNLRTNVFPTLNFTPANHFGAREAHVIEINCSNGQWRTIETFKDRF
ncbi:MAG: ABC transporter substrate-binding protein [Actinomycetota bacterium]